MIKIKAHWIIGVLLVVLISGCYKDLGNYNYHDINTITIKLDSSYTAVYGQRFTIQPNIQMTMDNPVNLDDTSKYSIEWYIIDPTYIPIPNAKFLLSTKRILDTVLSLKPGSNYPLTIKITDKNTNNVKWTANSLLSVTTSIFEGWLALCDVNGKSRLDMASWDNTRYKLIPSVLDSVASGLSMNGKPYNVTFCTQTAALGTALANAIYITTGEGTNRIDPETFKWSPNMNIQYDMLAPVSTGFTADLIHAAGQTNYLHSVDSNLYLYYKPNQVSWGATINVVTGETNPFKAAPFVAGSSAALPFGSILFDVTNKRFVRHTSPAQSCTLMPSSGTTLFNYNNIGMDLVYMAYSMYNGGEVNAVFKNAATNKFYLAKFTLAATITQTYYAEITGTNIANAELFAINPDYGYLFYNVGGKVYEYDLGLKKSFLMVDKGTSGISVLKFHGFQKITYQNGTKQTLYNKLIVASYDASMPSGSSGVLDLYNVPGINGNLTSYLSIPGFGKIKSLTYRER